MKLSFILVGLFLAVIGIVIIVNSILKKSRCTEVTKGKVTDIIQERNIERNSSGPNGITVSFYPMFEYKVGENIYTKRSSIGSSSPMYFVGQEVDIHYNPENPNEYYANQNVGAIIVGTGLTVVGVIIAVIGML